MFERSIRLIFTFGCMMITACQVSGQVSSREYFKLGKVEYDEGNYFEAIDFLDKAIVTDSANESALFLRGEAFLKLEKFNLALQDFNTIINENKSHSSRDAAYFLKRAIAKMGLHDLQGAEDDFSKALQLDPANGEIYYELAGLKYITLTDKNEAIHELDKAIQHNPENPDFFIRRAEYKISIAKYDFGNDENYESALRDVSFAISLDPKNFEYYLFRSRINKERGRPLESLSDYNKMIEIDPDRIESYTERGLIKVNSDQYLSAIEDFTKSIELNDGYEKNFRFRALCKYNIQDYSGAYDDYSVSINMLRERMRGSTEKDQVQLRRILADTYIKRGASATFMGNSSNACVDFRMAYDLGSRLGLNYLRKFCGI